MSCYFVASIRIKNDSGYRKYLEGVDAVFKKYKGKYLEVERDPELIEGSWDYSRSVIIEFPGRDEFREWYHSAEYQEILQHRLKAADCDSILLTGLPAVTF